MKKVILLLAVCFAVGGCTSIQYVEPSDSASIASINLKSHYKINYGDSAQVFELGSNEGCEKISRILGPSQIPLMADLSKSKQLKIPANGRFRMLVIASLGGAFMSFNCNTIIAFEPEKGGNYELVSTLRISPDICNVQLFRVDGDKKSPISTSEYQNCR